MKKLMVFLIAISFAYSYTAEAANPELEKLARKVASIPSYEVAFTIENVSGKYLVKGDSYYIHVPDAEVYGDGTTRYEVSRENREVVIDATDLTSRNLLTNPTRAFEYISADYSDKVIVEIDPSGLPREVIYKMEDGEHVTIRIHSFVPYNGTIPAFEKDKFSGYEIIDFR